MAPVLEEQVGAALVAMLLGALLGLERQRSAEDDGQPSFAGLRTFTLLSLAGFLGANLLAKGGIVVVTGGTALARRVLPAFLAMAVVTGLVFLAS